MPYPPITAGQRLTAAMLRDMQWQSVAQTDTGGPVNNSTTYVDTNIIVPTVTGATYMYRLLVGYASTEAADVRFRWQTPGGGEVRRFSYGPGSGGTGTANSFTAVAFRRPLTDTDVIVGGSGDGSTYAYHEQGIIIGDGFSATLQFAQGTATAVNTTITGSSRCDYIRIG